MKKNIVMYGSFLEYNLGLPSLLHGSEELFCEIFGEDNVSLVYYESSKLGGKISGNFKSKIKYIPFENNRNLLVSAIKYKLTKQCTKKQAEFFNDLKSADYIVDIYGIYFCSKLEKEPMSQIKAKYSAVLTFAIPFIGRWFSKNVKTVKTAASYGPFKAKGLNKKAEYAVNKIFDVVFARERQSAQALLENCRIKKDVCVTPDIANLMKYDKSEYGKGKQISVAVSHQLETQWKQDGDYKESVIKLLKHIADKLPEHKIVLIPNETSTLKKYNDITVAKSIEESVNLGERLVVLSELNFDAVDIKNEIAKSDVVISARYHSCVAALSAAIPTLVMGWHYKYDELLELYGQKEWVVSNPDEAERSLIQKFDLIWKSKTDVHNQLLISAEGVTSKIYNSYKAPFTADGENL